MLQAMYKHRMLSMISISSIIDEENKDGKMVLGKIFKIGEI